VASPARAAHILADAATRGSFTKAFTLAHCWVPAHHSALPSNVFRSPSGFAVWRSTSLRSDQPWAHRPDVVCVVQTVLPPNAFPRPFQAPGRCCPDPFGWAACRQALSALGHPSRDVDPTPAVWLSLERPSQVIRSSAPVTLATSLRNPSVGHGPVFGGSPLRVIRLLAAVTLVNALRQTTSRQRFLLSTRHPYGQLAHQQTVRWCHIPCGT
jgi:hypothetical protein